MGPRLQQKLSALEAAFPRSLQGRDVLDVGCDFGFWSFYAAAAGARRVVGLDRSRDVKEIGRVDLVDLNYEMTRRYPELYGRCAFHATNVGREFKLFGVFDLVLLFSLYHHIFAQVEDHRAIWYWLYLHVRDDGYLIWENPTSLDDPIARQAVPEILWPQFTEPQIFAAAERYFTCEYFGPAEHQPTRSVYVCRPRAQRRTAYAGEAIPGASGASPALLYNHGRRIQELQDLLGVRCVPGSLNVQLTSDFDWDDRYLRGRILDVKNRRQGLSSPWGPRWVRWYPVFVNRRIAAYAMRFEGEPYRASLMELIDAVELRPLLQDEELTIEIV